MAEMGMFDPKTLDEDRTLKEEWEAQFRRV
jgi:hypothetical protein